MAPSSLLRAIMYCFYRTFDISCLFFFWPALRQGSLRKVGIVYKPLNFVSRPKSKLNTESNTRTCLRSKSSKPPALTSWPWCTNKELNSWHTSSFSNSTNSPPPSCRSVPKSCLCATFSRVAQRGRSTQGRCSRYWQLPGIATYSLSSVFAFSWTW